MRARYGGTLATIGEAGRDEAVIPLPSGWERLFDATRSMGSTRMQTMTVNKLIVVGSFEGKTETLQPSSYNDNRTYHFHGDLSFPNIRSGEDAEDFIRNLEDMSGGR